MNDLPPYQAPPEPPDSQDSPLDRFNRADRLVGYIAQEDAARVRLRGHDVLGDLARHYSFAEVALLTMTGRAPRAEEGHAFEVALIALAPIPITEGPAHAARLARVVRCEDHGCVAAAASAAVQRARWITERHRRLSAWLEREEPGPLPEALRAPDEAARARTASLWEALPKAARAPLRELRAQEPAPLALALAMLWALGLRVPWQLQTALVVAGLPCAVAEGVAVPRGDLRSYPINVPPILYDHEAARPHDPEDDHE